MGWVDGFLDANKWVDDLVESVGATPEDALALDEIVYRLLAACAIGWLIGRVYHRTFTGKKLTASLPDTHMLLCIGGALIWLVVGNNLVRAFGLAGTIGLIRYRTIVRDPKDTPIILFSMVMGMSCGLGQFKIAIAGTMVVLCALVLLHRSHTRTQAIQQKNSNQFLDLKNGKQKPKDKHSPQP